MHFALSLVELFQEQLLLITLCSLCCPVTLAVQVVLVHQETEALHMQKSRVQSQQG